MTNQVKCPCCDSYTVSEVGGYEICPVCGWEDDPVQLADPDCEGGANHQSLSEARQAWLVRKRSSKSNSRTFK